MMMKEAVNRRNRVRSAFRLSKTTFSLRFSSVIAATAVMAVMIGTADRSVALNLDGGPVDAGAMGSPVTGSCTVTMHDPMAMTGSPCNPGGATISCTGINPGSFQNLYFGLSNAAGVNGHAIADVNPLASGNRFFLDTYTATTILYSASSSVTDQQTAEMHNVASQLQLLFDGGTGAMASTGGFPADSAVNGDIGQVWKVNATDFDVVVELFATSQILTTPDAACTNIVEQVHQASNLFDRSDIELGFYYENSCDLTPRMGCAVPGKSILKIKNSGVPLKNKLSWKWLKGTVASKADFGTPLVDTSYRLCFYDEGTGMLMNTPRPQVGAVTNWSDTGSGYKYKNALGNEKGVSKMALKSGASGKAKIQVLARGPSNSVPDLPIGLSGDLRVQLTKDTASGSECWETVFPFANVDDGDNQLKARFP